MVRQGLPRSSGDDPGAESKSELTTPPAAPPKPDTAAPAVRRGLSVLPDRVIAPATVPVEPAPPGTRPEPAVGRRPIGRTARAILIGVGLIVLLALAVLLARWLVGLDGVRDFMTTYPGQSELPEGAPVGFPAWLGWQHFFNTFLIVLIIRSGWQVRTQKKPPASWTPKWSSGRKISITLWLHQSLDLLWLVNGVIFVVLLFATGQWMRVVPTNWDIIPNAISAGLQYVSLDWPTEHGWVNYNALQLIAYFVTIFIVAPLAAITGVRMSGLWPAQATRLNRLYPVEWARAVHLPVMLYFVAFIIAHVALVLATGALRNLNHMYGGQDAVNWVGFGIFAASLLVIVGGWFAARPLVIAPIASLFGRVGR
ncbi:hypothetical protein A20C1_03298 [marine actinobacterium PHSC20C1]|nr:hypothetical protein A20C1_03298 [marine actinobacterium PHSC20C1]